jgi:subtilisin family serine protease
MKKNHMLSFSIHLLLLSIVGSLVWRGVVVVAISGGGEENASAGSTKNNGEITTGDITEETMRGMKAMKGCYIVQYQDDVGFDVGDKLLSSIIYDTTKSESGLVQYFYRELFSGVGIVNATYAIVEALRDADFVKAIWQDSYLELDYTQGHPLNWGLDRIDDRELPMNGQYHYRFSGMGTEIYILDTGLYAEHKEFEPVYDGNNQMERPPVQCGYDVFGDKCEDEVGHGTYVAAIAAGASYGVAKKASVIAVKIHSHRAGGASLSTALSGLEYVFMQKGKRPAQPMVINFSLSGPASELLDNAVDALAAVGVVVVVSAGNRDSDSCSYSPASAGGSIVVSATDYQDTKAPYANYGECVNVYAPGHQIPSAWIRNRNDQVFFSGTSAAAAHVTGGK